MMRAHLVAAGLALAGALALSGCTGGEPETTPTPTPSNTATRWKSGEFRGEVNACATVTPALAGRLGLALTGGMGCDLRGPDIDAPVDRHLTVSAQVYQPPPARPDHTATEEARHEFGKPQGWGYTEGVTLPGYGDQARISRMVGTFQHEHTVKVAVRVRNAIVTLALTASTDEVTDPGKVTPIGDLETQALTVTRAVLTGMRVPPRPVRPSAYRTGEVRKVHDVCADARDAATLVPGGNRVRTSAPGGHGAGCAWTRDASGDSSSDSLVVTAEAVPPGADGGDATATAADATRVWSPGNGIEKLPGVGDAASVRTFDEDELRSVDLWARRGNLLVTVSYERWSGGRPVAALRADAVRTAKAVFARYR